MVDPGMVPGLAFKAGLLPTVDGGSQGSEEPEYLNGDERAARDERLERDKRRQEAKDRLAAMQQGQGQITCAA